MNLQSNFIPSIVALVAIIASGVVHGTMTHRWDQSDEAKAAADRLQLLPSTLGHWESTDGKIDPESARIAGLTGYCYRRYEHSRTGETVTMVLMCGSPGPVSVHPPTACYSDAGYELIGTPEDYLVEFQPDDADAYFDKFLVADFRKPDELAADQARIFWTWSADGNWQTPDNPRLAFASAGALYKLYVTEDVPIGANDIEGSASERFLRVVLPELRNSVFKVSD